MSYCVALYDHPAPPAQGLTDEEIDAIWHCTPYNRDCAPDHMLFARATLAASRTTPTPGEA